MLQARVERSWHLFQDFANAQDVQPHTVLWTAAQATVVRRNCQRASKSRAREGLKEIMRNALRDQ